MSEWMGDVGGGAAKGAALGAFAGPAGLAAGAAVGGLVGLARNLFPETVGGLLDGPRAAQAAPLIEQAVRDATGAAAPGAAMAALADNPEMGAAVKARLADVWAEVYRIDAEDRKDARAQTLELAKAGSTIAWGAPAMSVIVLALFGAALGLILWRGLPQGSNEVVLLLIGVLAGMAQTAVAYWLGSSAGSARKDQRLAAVRGEG